MRCVLVLAFVASCGFQIPGGTAADDVVPGDADPDGMLDDAPIDTPNDTPIPNEDQDGDTILDSLDNCVAVANTNQRNHDGDPFGDACDRCPHLFSATDPDGDGDGVGDACDPRPANNADRRVLWAGFYDASEIANWTGLGSYMVNGGFLQQTSINLNGIAPPNDVNVPFVMTELVLDTVGNGDIGLAVQMGAGLRYECAVTKNGTNENVRARVVGGSTDSTTWTGTFGVGSHITFRLDLANDVDCRAIQGATNIQRIASTNGDPTGRTYVGMEGEAARFDYLFVVDEMPP